MTWSVDISITWTPATGRRGGFLAETVLVNGRSRTRREYVTDVKATTTAFPDYDVSPPNWLQGVLGVVCVVAVLAWRMFV